jgi:hypothetical protein
MENDYKSEIASGYEKFRNFVLSGSFLAFDALREIIELEGMYCAAETSTSVPRSTGILFSEKEKESSYRNCFLRRTYDDIPVAYHQAKKFALMLEYDPPPKVIGEIFCLLMKDGNDKLAYQLSADDKRKPFPITLNIAIQLANRIGLVIWNGVKIRRKNSSDRKYLI